MPLILENYPHEILHEIFEHLSPGEAKHLTSDRVVRDYAVGRKFSCIFLDTTLGKGQTIKSEENRTCVPARFLPPLLEYNRASFRPHALQFDDLNGLLLFRDWQPDIVAKFKRIEQVGDLPFTLFNLSKIESLFPIPNLTGLNITSGGGVVNNSEVKLPESLIKLRTCGVTFQSYPEGLEELILNTGVDFNHKTFPKKLKRLVLKTGPLLKELISYLPLSLATLELSGTNFAGERQSIDLKNHLNLKNLLLKGVSTSTLMPQSLVSLHCSSMKLRNLNTITKLKNLKSLMFTSCSFDNPGVLNCTYPKSLQIMLFQNIRFKKIPDVDDRIKSWGTQNVLRFNVPAGLRSLTVLQMNGELYIHRDLLTCNNLRTLKLHLNGIYYDFNPEIEMNPDFLSLKGIGFLNSLECLQLVGENFTDVEEVLQLPNLKEVDISFQKS